MIWNYHNHVIFIVLKVKLELFKNSSKLFYLVHQRVTFKKINIGLEGIEPSTTYLSNMHSTTELQALLLSMGFEPMLLH